MVKGGTVPMPVTVKIDTSAVEKAFDQARKQIPFAIATAVNDVAFRTQRAENAAMSSVFKNPKPFTKNSTAVDRATKATLTATVRVKDAQAKYELPYEIGGVHELPGQALLNPKNVSLDQYGQLRKGQFKALAGRPDDFVGTIHGVTGLWRRIKPASVGKKRRGAPAPSVQPARLKLLVRFGDALPVAKHIDFVKRATALVSAELPSALAAAIEKTLRTMKP